ncbi:hypothetical protein [Glycomyces paridis]|uniref:Uncharacterized protein n=1 Tax=Glycomyces paridis TaxID=2126555 RepID=A0A4S8PCN0_9ACTN|nr:hypothetical protein [Glycomyces paridis]THV25999.1 hypothetical protein E9998_19895 [Glycomyces paridis]
MSERFTDEQRFELWRAFAGGDTPQYFSGFQDQHWTAGVDRLADVLAPMLDGEYEKIRNENKRLRTELEEARGRLKWADVAAVESKRTFDQYDEDRAAWIVHRDRMTDEILDLRDQVKALKAKDVTHET